jgi:hypothetical protein
MALRYYRNGPQRALAVAIANSTDTTMTVDAASGFPTQFPYTLILEPNTALEEVVDVSAAVGNTLTIARGADSTTASAHGAGTPVYHGVSARDIREANAHVNQFNGAHGTTGAIVDTGTPDQTITGRKLFADAESAAGGNFIDTGSAQSVTGAKTFDTLSTTAGGAVVAVNGAQTVTGNKSFTGTTTLASTVIDGVNVVNGWTGFVPIWLNGDDTTLLVGNGTMQGHYQRVGKSVKFRIELIRGSTTNVGNSFHIFFLPVAPVTYRNNGTATVFDQSTGQMHGLTWHGITGSRIVLVDPLNAARVSWNFPMTWAAGDEVIICGEYEAA